MSIRLTRCETKVMQIIWENEPIAAKQICVIASQRIGWDRNTTYTLIRTLEYKGALRRMEPGYMCVSRFACDEYKKDAIRSIIARFFNGSSDSFLSLLRESKEFSEDALRELQRLSQAS